jgi:penicillin-insensitive murein endopeptidase
MEKYHSLFVLFFALTFFSSCNQEQCENIVWSQLSDAEFETASQNCGNAGIQTEQREEDNIAANDTMAIGYYSNGSLKNSEDLLSRSASVHKILKSRNRSFATKELVDLIEDVATEMNNRFDNIEKMQVGDLSAKIGGFVSGHSSHQNGLDVDIVYYTNDQKLQAMDNSYWTQFFVSNGKLKNFSLSKNWHLFKLLVNRHPINRIFVDPVIKKAMCDYASSIGEFNSNIEVLRRLRPLSTHHDTHLHIRLKCPQDDLSCSDQGQPPAGSGC